MEKVATFMIRGEYTRFILRYCFILYPFDNIYYLLYELIYAGARYMHAVSLAPRRLNATSRSMLLHLSIKLVKIYEIWLNIKS
jgi:hypothetical protein